MADTRDNSFDSRYRGPVPKQLIWGTTLLVYWSSPIQAETVRWERVMKCIQSSQRPRFRGENESVILAGNHHAGNLRP